MNIVEFLDEVGHTKLCCQMLHHAVVKVSQGRGGATKVTFSTKQVAPVDFLQHGAGTSGKVGMVVWMPREDYERAMKASGDAA